MRKCNEILKRGRSKQKKEKKKHSVSYCSGQFDTIQGKEVIEHDGTWFPGLNEVYCMCAHTIQSGNKQPFPRTKGFV